MKKVLLLAAFAALILVSCEKDANETVLPEAQEIQVDMSDFFVYTDEIDNTAAKGPQGKTCATMRVLNEKLRANPGLEQRMYNIEKHTRTFIASKKPDNPGGGNGGGSGGGGGEEPPVDDGLGVINIPVVVHVIYNNANENISNTQINSQIAILNDDFNGTNNDSNGVPGEFASLVADSDFTFSLAQVIRV
ncbi:MAG: zinc metalloprotease, partial [Eudoraea sp.]|nr:zinc metalloprotease [Eudoraea sp.]NNJ40732.1 zinc metalloprotease [Eudoraea sp.]